MQIFIGIGALHFFQGLIGFRIVGPRNLYRRIDREFEMELGISLVSHDLGGFRKVEKRNYIEECNADLKGISFDFLRPDCLQNSLIQETIYKGP